MTDLLHLDPKGLFRESYRIDEITDEQCRSIFLDWALSLPDGTDAKDALRLVLETFEPEHPNHPMTDVLKGGLQDMGRPKRRGGWRSRPR